MKRTLALLSFALLLIGTRLLVATTAPDVFQRGEEYVRGAATLAITGGLLDGINAELVKLDQPEVGLEALFYHAYEGGGFVHAVITAPFFSVFGPSLLAHKLVAISVELLVLYAGLWLVREVFGQRAELPFVLLFVFAPLAFQKIALLNLGIHYQALGFQFALAALGLGALRGNPRPLSTGIVGGFGLFYNYQLAPLIGLLAVCLLWKKSLTRRDWSRLIAGFVVGGLPLWLMFWRTGWAVLNIHGQTLGQGTDDTNWLSSMLVNLASSLGIRGFVQLFLLLGLALWVGISSPGPARLVLGYLLVFAALIPVSGFMTSRFVDYFSAMRYAPLYGFATLLAAGAISQQHRSRWPQIAFAILTVLGISSTASALGSGTSSRAGWQHIASTRGVDFTGYLRKIYSNLPESLREQDSARLRALMQIEGAPRAELLTSATSVVTRHMTSDLAPFLSSLQTAAPDDWQQGLYGLGGWAMRPWPKELLLGYLFIENKFLRLPESVLAPKEKQSAIQFALEGLGRAGTGSFPTIEKLRSEIEQVHHLGLRNAIYLGLGWRIAYALRVAPWQLEAVLEGYDKAATAQIRLGFEKAQATLRVAPKNH